MAIEKLTREILRGMRIGETRTFTLPGARAIDNSKANAYMLQNQLECRFRMQADYANNLLTVTKTPQNDQS